MNISEKLAKVKANVPKVYNSGREDAKRENREKEEAINTALENLLEIQESYLPEILSFTFEDANGVTYSLEFEKGMTWGEWCESFYNTVGMYINTDEGSQVLYWGVSTVVKLIDPENVITASKLIEAERTYKAV